MKRRKIKRRTEPMTQIIKLPSTPLQVADIIRMHLADYRQSYTLFPDQQKIVSHLTSCRTEKLGGRIERCDNCALLRILYHSCRDRHCPTCQQIPRERWCQDRKREILPVPYYHIIFTLPHDLNPMVLSNKSVMFNLLSDFQHSFWQLCQNLFDLCSMNSWFGKDIRANIQCFKIL